MPAPSASIAYGAPLQAEAFALAAGCTPLMIAARGLDGSAAAMVGTLLPLSNPNQQPKMGYGPLDTNNTTAHRRKA